MRWVAAPLAAALVGLAVASCGGGGAEPGAPEGATLVLDFQPNAVHSGIYAAQAEGGFRDEGLDLRIQQPSSSADGAKLLESGRADYAVMDINDFGIARQRGLDLVAIAAVVRRPLAAVIAADRNEIHTPADLAGKTVGVTGVPSDDAVLDTVLRSGGVNPGSVKRVNIGFNAVAALSAGKVDAATAFWNAEGVELQAMGVPIREFRVDEFGAPRYPELLLVTRGSTLPPYPMDNGDHLVCRLLVGLEGGYKALADEPKDALRNLLESNPGLDPSSQRLQFDALVRRHAWSTNDRGGPATARLNAGGAQMSWAFWAARNHLIAMDDVRSVAAGFDTDRLTTCNVASDFERR